MSILALTSNTLVGTPGAGQIEYNGQFFGTDSNASRAQLQRITAATAVASTSGTSISFTSLPSWIKRITVMLNAVSSNGSSIYLVQLGTGGTATTTGYLTSATQLGGGAVTSFYTTGFGISHSASNQVWSGHFTLTNISGNIWVGSGTSASQTGSALTSPSAGNITLGGVLDMVRFTTVNGTDVFNAGSVNILYEG